VKKNEKVRAEVYALHKLVVKHASDDFYDQKEINLLSLLINDKVEAIKTTKGRLTADEIQLLMFLFPRSHVPKDQLIKGIDSVLRSPLTSFSVVAQVALMNIENDYYVKLVEICALEGHKFRGKMSQYNPMVIGSSTNNHELLEKKSLTDIEARLVLATISFFDKNEKPRNFPYSKILNLLKTSDRYSDMNNLKFDSYEFAKLYILRRLTQRATGEDRLIARRRRVLETYPPRGITGWDIDPIISDTSLLDYIRFGADLKRFFEENKITESNLFRIEKVENHNAS
jgi:hypothetical protein